MSPRTGLLRWSAAAQGKRSSWMVGFPGRVLPPAALQGADLQSACSHEEKGMFNYTLHTEVEGSRDTVASAESIGMTTTGSHMVLGIHHGSNLMLPSTLQDMLPHCSTARLLGC